MGAIGPESGTPAEGHNTEDESQTPGWRSGSNDVDEAIFICGFGPQDIGQQNIGWTDDPYGLDFRHDGLRLCTDCRSRF